MSGRGRAAALGLAAAMAPAAAGEPLWEAGFGATALRLPHYRGSAETSDWLLPLPYFVYRGSILRADRDGARATLLASDRIRFDLSLGASPPTDSADDSARQGMPDLAPTVEIGPKLNARLGQGDAWKLELRLPLRAVVTLESRPRAVGWSLSPVLNLDLDVSGFDIGLQAGPLWGDRRLHGTLYGVDAAYASPARPAYDAPGGFAGWQATAGVSRRFGRAWFGAFLRSDSVAGAAFEASPLVTGRQQFAFGVALAWIFAASDERVADER